MTTCRVSQALRSWTILLNGMLLLNGTVTSESAASKPELAKLTAAIRAVSPQVLSQEARAAAASMINRDLRRRRDAANERNRAEWSAIQDRNQWKAYRNIRLARLRESLGDFSTPPKRLDVRVTGSIAGNGFHIENLVYETRPGDWVAGNLYVPAKKSESMPGILIAHAHHRPKVQGELQDMGMTWARAGCVVLVIDQLGYGERRAHPFDGPEDYPQVEYRHWRQDYYYRYDSGIQLQLIGESLMGWMVWDLMRGVDLLLSRDGIDRDRIILLGAVAGGGDPCGVTAALDQRISAAVPFNFGGPQPETRYPLPDDAETSFNYLMGSYWESTRGLRRTAVDGFFHWVIVGGIAPRRLIHAHEFAWDGERDPVWRRFQKIYGEFYGLPHNLAFAHGKGLLRQRPPQSSHCTNIGAFHRRMIHPVFNRWFDIDVTTDDEYSDRRTPEELICLTESVRREIEPVGFVQRVSELAGQQLGRARRQAASLALDERRRILRENWSRLLGDVTLPDQPRVSSAEVSELGGVDSSRAIRTERIALKVEPDVVVPLVLMSTEKASELPVVVALAQGGKQAFLKHRAGEIAELIAGGAAVCLPDFRGTGETKAGTSRGRTSGDGNRSVNMLLYDQSLLGQRLRDLKAVLAYLRSRPEGQTRPICLWGDSFAEVNPPDTQFKVPYDVSGRPHQSEPLGGILALLGGLFDKDIQGIYIASVLSRFESVLSSPHVYVPHDVVVPGVLTVGDLSDVASMIAPRPLQITALVDGLNRPLSIAQLRQVHTPTVASYRQLKAEDQLTLGGDSTPAEWLRALRTSKP